MHKKNIVSLIVLVIISTFFIRYVIVHRSDFTLFFRISPIWVLGVALSEIFLLIVNGIFLKVIIKRFNIGLEFCEYISISIVTAFFNAFLPMRGGAGLRAFYLKRRYKFAYSHFISSLTGNYVIIYCVSSFCALIGLIVLHFRSGHSNYLMFIIFACLFFVTCLIICFSPANVNWIKIYSIRKPVNKVLDGWRIICTSRKTVFKLVVLTAINLFLIGIIMLYCFRALGLTALDGTKITFVQSFYLGTVSVLSLLISITPASLGIREGFFMIVAEGIGVDPSHALAVSVLERIVIFILLLVSVPFALFYLKLQRLRR